MCPTRSFQNRNELKKKNVDWYKLLYLAVIFLRSAKRSAIQKLILVEIFSKNRNT